MANKQEFGRHNSNVPAGEYGGYKRLIEQRRRMAANDGDDYAENAESQDSASDELNTASAEAYTRTSAAEKTDADLESALGADVDNSSDEDEASMPEPRRRARSYRGDKVAPKITSDKPEREAEEDDADERTLRHEKPQFRRPAPQPVDDDNPQDDEDEPDAQDFAEYSDDSARGGKIARKPRFAKETASRSRVEDDLEDYRGDDTSYNNDVYEPYEEDDMDVEDENAESESEWTDGIKRAFSKGRASLLALGAKAKSGGKGGKPGKSGKKRPSSQHQQKKRRPQVAGPVQPQIDQNADLEDYNAPNEAELARQMRIGGEETPRQPMHDVDYSEYERVSEDIRSFEEPEETPVSRRQRRMSQEQPRKYVDESDMPKVNLVSRRAMRAQQQDATAQAEPQAPAQTAAPAQPAEAQAAQQPEVTAPAQPIQEPVQPVAEQAEQMPEQPAQMPEQSLEQPEQMSAQIAPEYMQFDDANAQSQPETQAAAAVDDSDMIFGIHGHQHIMQPQPIQSDNAQPESDDARPAPSYRPAAPVIAADILDDSTEDEQPEQIAPQTQKLSRKERKAQRKARKNAGKVEKQSRQRDFDLDDDDDDDAPTAVSGDTARYSRRDNVLSAAPMGSAHARNQRYYGDDDEPEDDGVQDYAPDNAQDNGFGVSAYGNDYNNTDDVNYSREPYREEYYEEDEDEENYEEPVEEEKGGCLKACTIFLVIMVILFGSVWALDYFNVISVRKIANSITAMSIFDPLRGNILPAAVAPTPNVTTPASENGTQAAPTMQPADGTQNNAAAAGTVTADPAATADPLATPEATQQLNNNSPEMQNAQANVLSAESFSQLSQPTAEPQPTAFFLNAAPVESALPDNERIKLEYGVYVNYEKDNNYQRENPISFGIGKDYSALEGVITFRGNNFRENAAYGTAALSEKQMEIMWKNNIGGIDSGYAYWSGVGWNGQPVMIHWSDEMRRMMNIKDEYKDKSDLVEVIYGALDGKIYFLNAEDGKYTRDPINLGFPIKGSVSIDPRGYPLLYVGQGISKANGKTGSIGWRVYNLLNQEHMYLLNGHDELRFRTHGSFDGVCLLDAETDTIVEGAENGIFYTIKLNTQFDPAAPSISIDPEVTLYRYKSRISDELGIENSVAAYGQYAYFVDNSGLMTCMDLNSMSPVWLYDVGDDTDASISLEQQSDGMVAMYTANEVDKQGSSGLSTIRKLNALTGETLWDFSVECKSDSNNGGGAFASPAMGKNSLSELVYFNICRTSGGGTLYAFNKQTGEIVWQQSTKRYSWSSPVIVYTESGEGVVIVANSAGTLRMYNGLTGEVYDELDIEGNVEGSPAVYNDMLVVGTRDQKIYGIKIK